MICANVLRIFHKSKSSCWFVICTSPHSLMMMKKHKTHQDINNINQRQISRFSPPVRLLSKQWKHKSSCCIFELFHLMSHVRRLGSASHFPGRRSRCTTRQLSLEWEATPFTQGYSKFTLLSIQCDRSAAKNQFDNQKSTQCKCVTVL